MTTSKNVLLVLTSNDDLGGVRKTGYYISEAADPWKVFTDASYNVDIASIKGGVPPEVGRDDEDVTQQAFLSNPHVAEQLMNTTALADVDTTAYDAIFFVGGHGTMWDFPTDPSVNLAGHKVYESGGIVSAVCHGPAALVNMTLSDGSYIVNGKRVAGFTNDEEEAAGLTEIVPFLLADTLTQRGATHIPGPSFVENVVVDGRLITGQNPQSATGVAEAIVKMLSES